MRISPFEFCSFEYFFRSLNLQEAELFKRLGAFLLQISFDAFDDVDFFVEFILDLILDVVDLDSPIAQRQIFDGDVQIRGLGCQ